MFPWHNGNPIVKASIESELEEYLNNSNEHFRQIQRDRWHKKVNLRHKNRESCKKKKKQKKPLVDSKVEKLDYSVKINEQKTWMVYCNIWATRKWPNLWNMA